MRIRNKLPGKWSLPWVLIHAPLPTEAGDYYGLGDTESFAYCISGSGVQSSAGGIPKWCDLLASKQAVLDLVFSTAKQPNQVTVYGHRIPRLLTLLGVWEGLDDGEWIYSEEVPVGPFGEPVSRGRQQNGLAILSGPPTVLRVKHRQSGQWVTWVDLSNYGFEPPDENEPVAQFEPLDLPPVFVQRQRKMELAFDAYCRTQSQLFSLFQICRDLGRFKPPLTLGSVAWESLTSGRLLHKVETPESKESRVFQRLSLYGGRCESFCCSPVVTNDYAISGGKLTPLVDSEVLTSDGLHYVDINSCYGSVMAECTIPSIVETPVCEYGDYPIESAGFLGYCIATVTLETDTPYFPQRTERGVVYPVGRFVTTLPGPELLFAESHGCLRVLHQWERYYLAEVMSTLSGDLLRRRAEAKATGSKDYATLCKLLLNAASGCWARKTHKWRQVPDEAPLNRWGEWLHFNEPENRLERRRAIAGVLERLDQDDTKPETFPATLSWIQSYARLRLLRLIELAGWEHVLYCDTDGLIIDGEGLRRLRCEKWLMGDKPGQVSLRDSYDWVDILGPKRYATNLGSVMAGIPTALAKLDEVGWKWRSSPSSGSLVTGVPTSEVRWVDRMVPLSRDPSNRVATRDGWSVPYKLGGELTDE